MFAGGREETMKLQGRVWKFGSDIDTDAIIPARYLNLVDPIELGKHAMEDERPEFVKEVKSGDILVAGKNFGCGSSREHAPLVLKVVGISCIIAKSFARIFYRNGFNQGLPLLESAEAAEAIQEGDQVRVDLGTGEIEDLTQQKKFRAKPIPPFMQELIDDGGLVPHLRKKGGWRVQKMSLNGPEELDLRFELTRLEEVMKKEKYNVAVVGATGAVGNEMVSILQERHFPVHQLKLLASTRSSGTQMEFKGKQHAVEVLDENSFAGTDIGLFSAGGSVSEKFAPVAGKAGCVVIDNTSAFRMDPQCPLVVPEVNPSCDRPVFPKEHHR